MMIKADQSKVEIWKIIEAELRRGALDSKHPFRYLNLGSFGVEFPEIRTVVLRKVDENLNCFVFTDFRSAKVKEIQSNENVSLHFYHSGKRLQLRIQAKAIIHYRDELAKSYWKMVQNDAMKAYNSVLAPGEKIQNPMEGWDWMKEMDDHNFVALKFVPFSIEVLQLDGLNHLRLAFQKHDEDWKGEWLVP